MVQVISLDSIDEYVEDSGYRLRETEEGWEMVKKILTVPSNPIENCFIEDKVVVKYHHKGVKFIQLCVHYIVMSTVCEHHLQK